jgi:hypothetical protein
MILQRITYRFGQFGSESGTAGTLFFCGVTGLPAAPRVGDALQVPPSALTTCTEVSLNIGN